MKHVNCAHVIFTFISVDIVVCVFRISTAHKTCIVRTYGVQVMHTCSIFINTHIQVVIKLHRALGGVRNHSANYIEGSR